VFHYRGASVAVELALPGAHNRCNALAAAALSLQAGATLEQIRQGLEQVRPVAGRLSLLSGRAGSCIIDDAYNASPESMRSAIAVLAARPGHRVMVAGDMGELGEMAARLHRTVGEEAAAAGIERLYAVGSYATEVAEGFGRGGSALQSVEALLPLLEAELQHKSTILVKGSRFMKMERVVEALVQEGGAQPHSSGVTP
jgi:UDP-N-acetylmuramoyl-tripeptide--D-alanyl-D-alanine ligase